MKQNDMEAHHIPNIIVACCILHNVCEIHGSHFLDSWLDSDASTMSSRMQPSSTTTTTLNTSQSSDIRDTLVQYLRVQCHAHACIFGWLLGDCISETTADIPRNQRPMLQDWRRLYTLQTMSAESARRKRDGRS